ncbi:hypothetical protein IKQ21_08775 [bacterium]|nr:hypothetical protein [bacterium]
METVNLLDFLNSAKDLYALDYARCDGELVNFLDLMTEDEQFTRSIDLGIVFVFEKTDNKYIIVDGLGRIVSLSLLLHAICECYKKTTTQNEKAIKTIRSKYLLKNSNLKLHLSEKDNVIYEKIINGERLSGREKSAPLFVLLHNFWSQIKEEKLQASKIFDMLKKIEITLVETDDVSRRDLFYKLNRHRNINQILLIDDFMKENKVIDEWIEIKSKYFVEKNDIYLFLKDFFITKFNYKRYSEDRLYESFVNYFETMKQDITRKHILQNIERSAMLYYNILNLNFDNDDVRNMFIQIKKHGGEDTYAYILSVYEDYYRGNLSESIFLEILQTVDEYLKNRQSSEKNIDFNELIQYLNAFIACK